MQQSKWQGEISESDPAGGCFSSQREWEVVCSYRISEATNNNIKADLFEDKSIMALTLVYSIVLNIDIQHDIMD